MLLYLAGFTPQGPFSAKTDETFQIKSLLRCLSESKRKTCLERNIQIDEICSWQGIKCVDSTITEIEWKYDDHFPIVNLNWLPSLTQTFKLEHCDIDIPVQTRMIPLAMLTYSVVSCSIAGTIDLRSLPRKMTSFNMRSNLISGVVYLDNLPPLIKCINLEGNRIIRVYVDGTKLPQSLGRASFRHPYKTIRIVYPKGSPHSDQVIVRKQQPRM